MGVGPALGATRDYGRVRVSLFVLAAGFALLFREPAQAQETPACAPAIARVVSLQGDVHVQRGGAGAWSSVRRLDTTVCAGDRLRVAGLSRAALFVQPETLVRLDQNTTITLRQTAEVTHIELHADELATGAQKSRCCGAVYLITRFPKKFKVTTPHMNAAVEGTEFMVEASREASKLTVIEGTVSSESLATGDTELVSAGQSVVSGPSGASAIATVVRPQDAVQWVLRYPPISDHSTTSGISSAENLLRAGSVDDALKAIDAELASNPSSSDAHALRSVIQVAKNDKASALESALKATETDAANYRGWLATSYAQQAAFDLEGALASARKAGLLRGDSSLAHARVAELLLSLGDSRNAEQAARAAIRANPAESHAHSMLGFIHLTQIDTKAARSDFAAAIDRDSFSALPRLGLGLAIIRDGELIPGREQIEIAVALDPSNSLLRSYVGKAYYEEGSMDRDSLAATQFELARQLDPRDPTPLLYDAIRLQTINQPVDAVTKLQESIALNDNRAVFRSKEFLVEDGAVRSVSLARAYHEIGFNMQAFRESAASIIADPGSSSAHRFLADSYVALPRHEIARRSELLQSQLTQPLNTNPIQPQLTEDNFFVLKATGPTGTGFNEYTPMYTRNGLAFQADVLGGNLGTWGDQLIVSGLQDRTAFAFSQLAYSTEGTRANDDFDKRLYGAFVQHQAAPDLSVQADIRHSNSRFGDPLLAFDPNLVIDDRHDVRDLRIRLGMRKDFAPGSHFIVSLAAIDQRERIGIVG